MPGNHAFKTEVLADGFEFLEGPRWRDDRLWMSDFFGGQVFTVGADGGVETVVEVPGRPSGLGFLPDGTLLIVSMTDRRVLRLAAGELVCHAELGPLVTGDANDMVVDAQGRAYVGNFGFDLWGGADFRNANLVMVTPAGEAQVVAEDMAFPNGTVILPGDEVLVVAETFGHGLTAFDIASDGTLSNRREFADLGDYGPDGICLDQEGAIWVSALSKAERSPTALFSPSATRSLVNSAAATAARFSASPARALGRKFVPASHAPALRSRPSIPPARDHRKHQNKCK